MKKLINIPDDWYRHLQPVIESNYFKNLAGFIATRRKEVNIFPESSKVFRAFNETPFSKIRVVILGMDPYPNLYKGQPVACGLAFAPSNPEYTPPSLRMIYKNLKEGIYKDDMNFPEDLNFENWAKQGVLLLNAALTVEESRAGSHLSHWKPFTEAVLKAISENSSGVIFCFWGKDAQQFAPLISDQAHHKLLAPHPVSAVYKGGTWDCNHFEEINRILLHNNGDSIEWLSF